MRIREVSRATCCSSSGRSSSSRRRTSADALHVREAVAVIWTDGRQLPTNPDPRWYGYSVGHWEDDYTFVVNQQRHRRTNLARQRGQPAQRPAQSGRALSPRRPQHDGADGRRSTTQRRTRESWVGRDKLRLTLLPANTDLMEMIPSAERAAAVKSIYAAEAAGKK